jgi:hypothetical protein
MENREIIRILGIGERRGPIRQSSDLCSKCSGLMFKEMAYTQQGSLLIYRCIHCGEVIDPLIVSNRS